jgi:hypothetical protein
MSDIQVVHIGQGERFVQKSEKLVVELRKWGVKAG